LAIVSMFICWAFMPEAADPIALIMSHHLSRRTLPS
jgi:hypothetical protein